MSADNGTYVAHFPNGEMRVAYGSASVIDELESHFYSPEEARDEIGNIFGGSKVYVNHDEALLDAHAEDGGETEYGVTEIHFSANFEDLREAIPEPTLTEGACVFCSTPGYTETFHGSDACDKDPSTPQFVIRETIRGNFPGINEWFVARVVAEVLNERFTFEPKPKVGEETLELVVHQLLTEEQQASARIEAQIKAEERELGFEDRLLEGSGLGPEYECRYPGCKMVAVSDGRCLGTTHEALRAVAEIEESEEE